MGLEVSEFGGFDIRGLFIFMNALLVQLGLGIGSSLSGVSIAFVPFST